MKIGNYTVNYKISSTFKELLSWLDDDEFVKRLINEINEFYEKKYGWIYGTRTLSKVIPLFSFRFRGRKILGLLDYFRLKYTLNKKEALIFFLKLIHHPKVKYEYDYINFHCEKRRYIDYALQIFGDIPFADKRLGNFIFSNNAIVLSFEEK